MHTLLLDSSFPCALCCSNVCLLTKTFNFLWLWAASPIHQSDNYHLTIWLNIIYGELEQSAAEEQFLPLIIVNHLVLHLSAKPLSLYFKQGCYSIGIKYQANVTQFWEISDIGYQIFLRYLISDIVYMILHWLEWSNTSIPICCSIGVIVDKLIL